MEDAPIPRHERTWRHPSELSTPAVDYVEPAVRGRHLSALAVGAVVALAAVGLLIAIAPAPGGTTAVSATTIAPIQLSGNAAPDGRGLQAPDGRTTTLRATPLRAAFDPSTVVASREPLWYEPVLVITGTEVHRTFWRELLRGGGPDDAIVVNLHGQVVAHCDGSEVHVVAGAAAE